MLLVKTRIGDSKIHGIGLFADQFIPKGTMVWKFLPGFDLKFTPGEVERLPEAVRIFVLRYAYLNSKTGYYVLCSDDARFYNHSEAPNTAGTEVENTDGEDGEVAITDIQSGEEITYDYKAEDADWKRKLNI